MIHQRKPEAVSTSRLGIALLFVVLSFLGALLVSPFAHAAALVAGDLAPRGNTDGNLTAGDLLVLQRLVFGQISPTADELLCGDVAPLGAPDGVLNAADVGVLSRAILGRLRCHRSLLVQSLPR